MNRHIFLSGRMQWPKAICALLQKREARPNSPTRAGRWRKPGRVSGPWTPAPTHTSFPPYRIPFKHIGTQKQLFLDNYILDELIDSERVIVRPDKAASPLIAYDDLPWERYHFTCVPAAALYDPDDGLYKMWYKTLVSGNTNSAQGTEVALCYAGIGRRAELAQANAATTAQPFGDQKRTNIVMRDFDNGTIVLNQDGNDPSRKFLAVYNPSMEAVRRGNRVMSRVAASPDGISWQVISDDTPFRHHHQMRVIWDDAYGKWVGYSQASHAFASHLHIRTIGPPGERRFHQLVAQAGHPVGRLGPRRRPQCRTPHDVCAQGRGALHRHRRGGARRTPGAGQPRRQQPARTSSMSRPRSTPAATAVGSFAPTATGPGRTTDRPAARTTATWPIPYPTTCCMTAEW